MAEKTGIAWCDATFNPWVGCEKVSPGCAHCYAETLVTGSGPRQLNRPGTWGPDGVRSRTSSSTWRNPVRWERLAREGKLPNGDENPDGHRPRVFCASLADVFEPRPELAVWRLELLALIAQTPSLDWLLLTKRPVEARDWLRAYYEQPLPSGRFRMEGDWNWSLRRGPNGEMPGFGVLPNIWIGTSVENSRFTWRADVLREIPAAVRFLSCEPLLGSLFQVRQPYVPDQRASQADVEERSMVGEPGPRSPAPQDRDSERTTDGSRSVPADAQSGAPAGPGRAPLDKLPRPRGGSLGQRGARGGDPGDELEAARGAAPLDLTGIDWVIVGGESGGRDARPMHPSWAREIRDAVLERGGDDVVTFDYLGPDPNDITGERWGEIIRPALFFKQWGSWEPDEFGRDPNAVWVSLDGRARGSLAADAYDDLPDGSMRMRYAGARPTAGGKLLDGVARSEFPEVER